MICRDGSVYCAVCPLGPSCSVFGSLIQSMGMGGVRRMGSIAIRHKNYSPIGFTRRGHTAPVIHVYTYTRTLTSIHTRTHSQDVVNQTPANAHCPNPEPPAPGPARPQGKRGKRTPRPYCQHNVHLAWCASPPSRCHHCGRGEGGNQLEGVRLGVGKQGTRAVPNASSKTREHLDKVGDRATSSPHKLVPPHAHVP